HRNRAKKLSRRTGWKWLKSAYLSLLQSLLEAPEFGRRNLEVIGGGLERRLNRQRAGHCFDEGIRRDRLHGITVNVQGLGGLDHIQIRMTGQQHEVLIALNHREFAGADRL